MKQMYFTQDTIEQKAREMVQECRYPRNSTSAQFVPEQSALLVLDMQSYFLDPDAHAYIPSAQAILPGIQALVAAFADRNLPIVFTRHQNTFEDAGQMATWWRELLLPDHPLGDIVPELDVSKGMLILKSQYDSFYQTDLEDYLHGLGVRQVVISGVMTHLCCETTARAAFMRGFEVFFLADRTAAYHEKFHKAALLNLSHGFAHLALGNEIITGLK